MPEQAEHTTIPFLDLAAVNAASMPELEAAAQEIIRSGWYILGESCEQFEKQFADYCGADHCIGVGNGLDALALTLRAWLILGDISPGAEVIVPANTFIATVLAVVDCGLTPVLVEPSPETFLVSTETVREAVTERTGAVIAVHLYGQPTDMEDLAAFCSARQIRLLEDAAQAHGAQHRGRRCGSLGDAAAFSFYPAKNLGALGDGGAVTTNSAELADCVRQLGNYGSSSKYVHVYPGRNSRLDPIQAAMLSLKLRHLDAANQARRTIAERYRAEISNPGVRLPDVTEDCEHVWHLFVVRVTDRQAFQNHMLSAGVQTAVHYPIPPHQQAAFPEWHGLSLPVTERLHREVVSLPISPVHSERDITTVIEAVNRYDAIDVSGNQTDQ